MLTPEGNSFEEMRGLVRSLFARGCRTFTMSFHSPSVDPGHTPYVRSSADLQSFLRCIEQFCEFFMQDMQGVAMSPQRIQAARVFTWRNRNHESARHISVGQGFNGHARGRRQGGICGGRRAVQSREAAGRLSVALASGCACSSPGSRPARSIASRIPFFTSAEETRLFRGNLDAEREFIDDGGAVERSDPRGDCADSRAIDPPSLAWPTPTSEWRRGWPSRSRTGSWPTRALSRAMSPNDCPSSGAVTPACFTRSGKTNSKTGSKRLACTQKLKRVEHHLSHAANAYFNSGFDEALIVTLDGYGSGLAGTISVGRGRPDSARCMASSIHTRWGRSTNR